MISIHDKPSLRTMLAPGRKPRPVRSYIRQEIARLERREAALEITASHSPNPFARMLASEHAGRVSSMLELLVKR